jgi:hypothetical protein
VRDAPASALGRQLAEIDRALHAIDVPRALIGGLALAAHHVVRATEDVDLLVDADHADAIDGAITALGYRCMHRDANAANYVRGRECVDLLFARRPIARRLLAGARRVETAIAPLRVVSAEGLIGFKVQALANDPRRTRDLEDIRSLLRENRSTLALAEVREYFRLFDREALLDELLEEAD